MPVAGWRWDWKGFDAPLTTESVLRASFVGALSSLEVEFGALLVVAEGEVTGPEPWDEDCKAGGGYRAKKRINRGGRAWASLTYWREVAMIAGWN